MNPSLDPECAISSLVCSIFAVLMALGFVGCGAIEEEVDEKDQAIEQLNRRDYDLAIQTLKNILSEDAEDDHARVLLASAYAGKVGMNTIDAFALFEPLLFSTANGSDAGLRLQESEVSDDDRDNQRQEFEARIIKLLQSLSDSSNIVRDAPHIQTSKRPLLNEALSHLDYVAKDSDYYLNAQAYGSILGMLQFLNYIRDAFPGLPFDGASWSANAMFCSLSVPILIESIDIAASYAQRTTAYTSVVAKFSKKRVSDSLKKLNDRAQTLRTVYNDSKSVFDNADLVVMAGRDKICD